MKSHIVALLCLSAACAHATGGSSSSSSSSAPSTPSVTSHNENVNLNANDNRLSSVTGVGVGVEVANTSDSVSGADALATSNATGTSSAVSTGGAGGLGGTGGGGVASANGQQALTQNYNQTRQTPGVFLPSIFVNECGAGVNGAGSKPGGAGAFGITWTTDKCYAFMAASNWVAMGAFKEACVLWADVNRRAFKRQHYTPDCDAIAARALKAAEDKTVLAPAPVSSSTAVAAPLPEYVTKPELIERERRMIESLHSK